MAYYGLKMTLNKENQDYVRFHEKMEANISTKEVMR